MYLKIYINLLPCIAVTGANFTWHLTQLKPHGLLQRQSSNARNLFVGVFPKVWTFSRFGYQLDHSFSLYCPVFEYHIKYSLRDWCTCFSFRKYQMTHSFSYDTYFLSVWIVGEKKKKKKRRTLNRVSVSISVQKSNEFSIPAFRLLKYFFSAFRWNAIFEFGIYFVIFFTTYLVLPFKTANWR